MGRRRALMSSDKQRRKLGGSDTCSITSMAHTISNCPFPDDCEVPAFSLAASTRCSAAACLYSSWPFSSSWSRVGSCDACSVAVCTFSFDASMARVSAPNLARRCWYYMFSYILHGNRIVRSHLCEQPTSASYIKHLQTLQKLWSLKLFQFHFRIASRSSRCIVRACHQAFSKEFHPDLVHSLQDIQIALLVPPRRRKVCEMRDFIGIDSAQSASMRCGSSRR